jgi:hypothetical protein
VALATISHDDPSTQPTCSTLSGLSTRENW